MEVLNHSFKYLNIRKKIEGGGEQQPSVTSVQSKSLSFQILMSEMSD